MAGVKTLYYANDASDVKEFLTLVGTSEKGSRMMPPNEQVPLFINKSYLQKRQVL